MRIRKQVSGIDPITPIVVVAVLCGLLLPSTVAAQTMNSDLTGVVRDSTGGVIPGVAAIATNESNRAQRSAVTDDLGVYRLAGIQPGTYTVEAELTGFKRFVQTGIVVSPGLLRRVDIVLDVGDVTDSVIVTDEVPVIQSNNATISTALPSQVRDKPIASMTRGALLGEQMIWAAGSAAGGVYGFVGNRADMNQYNVEGMQYNFISASVSNNIIEEVSTVLSNAPAEYARPVTLNATLKSGTNDYHAEYWMAGVNPCLNALRSPFSPARASRAPCVTAKRQFFNVGGPILKDKVFFFYSWARPNSFSNLSNSRPQHFPSLRMQGGDFSLYPSKIIDPTTGEQFPGNVIPAGRISPVAQAIMNDFMGSSVNYLGAPESYTNNVQQLAGRYRQDNDHNIKTDFNVGGNDSFSFHAVRHKVLSNTDRHHPSTGTSNALHTTLQDNVFNWQSGVTHSHVFGPGVVNQMRLGVTRFVYIHRQLKDWEGDAESAQGPEFVNRWGLQGVAVPDLSGIPQLNIGGWLRTYSDNESATYDTRYSFFNDVSVTEGRHNVKLGVSAVKLLHDGPAVGNYFGAFNFSNIFSGAQVAKDPMTCAAPAVCGDAFADFLLGLPSSQTRYQPRSIIARRKWEWGMFIQDDWNVTDKLNLSYGLRWSRYTVPYDKNGMYYNFDPDSLSIVVPDEFARERIHPSWPTHTFPVKLASEAGFPGKLIEGSNSWQPRVGFAYRMTPSTVLRGGWGIYNGASRFLPLQAYGPFVVSESFTNEVRPGSPTGTLYSWPNAFPTASDVITVSSAFGFAKDYHEAWTHNWNLTYEREVATNWGVQLTYRGVKSNDLLWGRNLNAVMASGTPWSRDRLPWPNLGNVNFVENGGDSIYNGIEFRLTHPWVNGLHSQLSLTKQWSGGLNAPIWATDQGITWPEYPFDLDRDRVAMATPWPSHDILWNFIAEMPFGRGKRFFADLNPVMNAIAGNWTFTGAFSWRSGIGLTPNWSGVDFANYGRFGGRPNQTCDDPNGGPKAVRGQWFNTRCYAVPSAGSLGNAQINSIVGPGAWIFNLNPYKEFELNFLREGARIQLGANIVNVLNHPVYGNPNTTVNSATAGQIRGSGNARGMWHDSLGQRKVVVDMRFIF